MQHPRDTVLAAQLHSGPLSLVADLGVTGMCMDCVLSRSASSLCLCWKKLCKQKPVQSYQTMAQNVVWGWQLVRRDAFSHVCSCGELYLQWPGGAFSCSIRLRNPVLWAAEVGKGRNRGKVLPKLLLLLFFHPCLLQWWELVSPRSCAGCFC